MTDAYSPAARRSRTLHRASAACLGASVLVGIVATALGAHISWPIWLLLGAVTLDFASNRMQSSSPRVSDCLVLAGAILSIAAVVSLVVMHP